MIPRSLCWSGSHGKNEYGRCLRIDVREQIVERLGKRGMGEDGIAQVGVAQLADDRQLQQASTSSLNSQNPWQIEIGSGAAGVSRTSTQ